MPSLFVWTLWNFHLAAGLKIFFRPRGASVVRKERESSAYRTLDRGPARLTSLMEESPPVTPAGFSAQAEPSARMPVVDGSGGTGKLAVAYKAARCRARAAFLFRATMEAEPCEGDQTWIS